MPKSQLLTKLNDEHYMGGLPWIESFRWDNERGEIGIYFCGENGLVAKLAWMFVICDGKIWSRQYQVYGVKAMLIDAQLLARFANATLQVESVLAFGDGDEEITLESVNKPQSTQPKSVSDY